MSDKTNVGLISLGCPKNVVDAEVMLHKIRQEGYQISPKIEDCEVVIVNTCGFIESAKQEAIDAILDTAEFKEHGKLKSLIVTGCLAQRYMDELRAEMPEVDAILGVSQYPDIVKYIRSTLTGKKVYNNKLSLDVVSSRDRLLTTPGHRAFLKIAEGCSNNCAYCAIPSIRGPYRSRPYAEVLDEAAHLVDCGVKEITLIAQDTTRYGREEGKTLMELLKAVSAIDRGVWIRVLYTYPQMLDRQLIETINENENICNYIDMPIQHINDRILSRMNRRDTRQSIADVYNMIKSVNPEITLRTTLITGFPGETESEFNELHSFIKDFVFDHIGVFAYCPEEGTTAYGFLNDFNKELAEGRRDKLMRAQNTISAKLLKKKKNQVYKALVELNDDIIVARSEHFAPEIDGVIYINDLNDTMPGEFAGVRILDSYEYDLRGEII